VASPSSGRVSPLNATNGSCHARNETTATERTSELATIHQCEDFYMTKTLGWVHLSDLHFLSRKSWRDSKVLTDLLIDLQKQVDSGARVDLVFCTGDISFGTFQGETLTSQYEDAKEYLAKVLDACHLPSERLFLVPGNHDTDRTKVSESITEYFRNQSRTLEQVNQLLYEGKPDVQRAMERLQQYREFLKTSFPHIHLDQNGVFGAIVSIKDLIVTITGLNSAWSCVDDKDKDKIWLGGATQMASAQKAIDVALNGGKPHLRIALLSSQKYMRQKDDGRMIERARDFQPTLEVVR